MKTLITKFTAIFLTLMVLMSCLTVTAATVSAAETTTSETAPSLIYDFGSVPLNVKSKLYSDDELQYPYYFIFHNYYGRYMVVFFKEKVDYLYVNNENDSYLRSPEKLNYTLMEFNSDGSYYGGGSTYYSLGFDRAGSGFAYGYSSSSDRLQNYVDNIVYSSFDIKCNGMTIYFAKNNKKVTIKDLVDLPAGSGGGEIVGPQPIPSDSKNLYGGYVEKNEETWSAFLAWLVENEYYTDLAKYGLVVTASNIGSIADTWYENKMSPTLFFEIVKQNGVNSLSSAEKIIGWFNRKWQEYISHNYEKVQVGTGGTKSDPHHRANLITDETDEDGNITDTTDISILRDILRRLIEIPSDIYSFFGGVINNIANNIYSLCLYAYDMPENVANATYNNFVEPLNLILDAINNSSGGTTTTENVTNNYYYTAKDVTDDDANNFSDLFDEYNTKFSSLISDKYPFLSQVEAIFNKILEACGESDTDVQSYSMTVQSDSPQQTQQDFINSKLSGAFDNYDPNYLKGVYASKAPTCTVSIAGQNVEIVDFRIFAKYRPLIYAVITLVLWVPYLWSLYRSIPSIIAGVSDIHNMIISDSIETNSEFEANVLVEAEQMNAYKVEDFKEFSYNEKTDMWFPRG